MFFPLIECPIKTESVCLQYHSEETLQIKKAFDSFDKDNDGHIEKMELKKAFEV